MFVPNFQVSQNFSTPTILSLVDNSTGSDVNIAGRRVYLQKSDGTYLVPSGTTTDFVAWSLAVSFINIDVLNKDYALNIRVDWVNAGGSMLYTKNGTYRFAFNAEFFAYTLAEKLATTPIINGSYDFMGAAYDLELFIAGSKSAIEFGGNIQASQASLDKAKYLIDNAPKFF